MERLRKVHLLAGVGNPCDKRVIRQKHEVWSSFSAIGCTYILLMSINVTTMSVRDSDQNIRDLFVSTESKDDGRQIVEYHLGTSLAVKQEDGTFKVMETGEVLTLPDA